MGRGVAASPDMIEAPAGDRGFKGDRGSPSAPIVANAALGCPATRPSPSGPRNRLATASSACARAGPRRRRLGRAVACDRVCGMDQKTANTKAAIAVMTEWLNEPSGTGKANMTRLVMEIVDETGNGDEVAGLLQLVTGFVNLTGHNLVHYAKLEGTSESELLQSWASRIARATDRANGN